MASPSQTTRPTPQWLVRQVKRAAKSALRPWAHPIATRRKITIDLLELGVRPGGIVLAHSSLSALGYVPGGAATVVHALLDAIGPQGALVLPTHTWEEMEAGGRTFDVQRTPCCVGAVPETFRTWAGVVRSSHPTHSVAALGPEARQLIESHELAPTPCGVGSPYSRLLDRDGQILFLGVGLESNTAFHTIEAICQAPYLMHDHQDRFTIIDQGRPAREVAITRHRPGVPRRFREQEEWLVEQGIVRRGRVGPARALLIAGAAFRDVMTTALQANPNFLLANPPGNTGQ